jgi:hypothetical protein
MFQLVRIGFFLLGAIGYQYGGLAVFQATGSFWGGLAMALGGGGVCLYGALSAGADGPPGPPGAPSWCGGDDRP